MVILHSKQFIFVKTIKTAGTSIEAALSTYRQPEDVFTVINKEIQGHKPQNYRGLYFPYKDFLDMFARYHRAWLKSVKESFLLIKYWNHIPAQLIRHRLGKKPWDRYASIAVERNPWEKALSFYYMIKGREKISFGDFLKSKYIPINYPLNTDQQGRVIVDRVYDYEKLYSDFSAGLQSIDIELKHLNHVRLRGNHAGTDYHAVFRQDYMRYNERIKSLFKEEIDLFGYELR